MGVEDGAVGLVPIGGLAAIVSEVPDAAYTADALNARLEDLRWVGERGLAHERVLEWFTDRSSVVPLRPFSLHLSEQKLTERLMADEARLTALLQRLEGRQEWGVKLWRDRTSALRHADELSPALADISRQIEQASPGKRFLLQKKRDGMLNEELRTAGVELARSVLNELRPLAERAAALDVPNMPVAAERALLLHAVFLVKLEAVDAFERRVAELSKEYHGRGFEIELSGPWPAYHFTEDEHAAQPA